MPTTAEKLESLLRWIHEKPQMYATMAGELDVLLHYLHMVWADLTARTKQYDSIAHLGTAKGLLNDSLRTEPVKLGTPATDVVLEHWNRIDTVLGIQIRCDSWHQNE